jgi:hypothetical protein
MNATEASLQDILIGLQAFQVIHLWIHDWVPLGVLNDVSANDVSAVRSEDSTRRLVIVTLAQSVPYTIGLWFSVQTLAQPYPSWLTKWLWISYGVLFVGQMRAWWVPYLFRAEPARAERYERMFGRTHSFLPKRNGMVPNTVHIRLHVATALTLVALTVRWILR